AGASPSHPRWQWSSVQRMGTTPQGSGAAPQVRVEGRRSTFPPGALPPDRRGRAPDRTGTVETIPGDRTVGPGPRGQLVEAVSRGNSGAPLVTVRPPG